MDKETILNILKEIRYEPYQKSIVEFGMVKYIKADGNRIEVRIFVGENQENGQKIVEKADKLLKEKFQGVEVSVVLLEKDPATQSAQDISQKPDILENVKLKVAIASGKGGVGKSTVAVNLARACVKKYGAGRVGLLDCDMYGPSATILFGEKVYPNVTPQEKIVPPEIEGIKVLSMGMLIEEDQSLLWRGAMVTSALKQFLEGTEWGDLDIMIFDLPPGTGDTVLSVINLVKLDEAIIVTTPNELARRTALRGANAFKQTQVNIKGLVENMSYIQMPDGSKSYIFGESDLAKDSERFDVPILASIPLDKTLQTKTPSDEAMAIFAEISDSFGA